MWLLDINFQLICLAQDLYAISQATEKRYLRLLFKRMVLIYFLLLLLNSLGVHLFRSYTKEGGVRILTEVVFLVLMKR